MPLYVVFCFLDFKIFDNLKGERDMNDTILIDKIDVQKDRVLLYSNKNNSIIDFYIIASIEQAKNLSVGDTIEYSDGGANFGWFVKKIVG